VTVLDGALGVRYNVSMTTTEVKTVAQILDERAAKAAQGPWVPACGGTEVPFTTRSRRRLLYCYQPSTGRHAYLDCETDLILSDAEAAVALGM
jgi:hypothetical protein